MFPPFAEHAEQVNRESFLHFLVATGRIPRDEEDDVRYAIHDAPSVEPICCPTEESVTADEKHPAIAGIRVELERLP